MNRLQLLEEYLIDTDSVAYGRQHMKTKLPEYFGDKIIITDIKKAAVLMIFISSASDPSSC